MNNQIPSSEGKTKNITLSSIISWILGIIFAIVGFVSLFSTPLVGIFFLLASAVLIPPILKKISGKFNLSRGVKIVLIIIFLALAGISVSHDGQIATTNEVNTSDAEKTEEPKMTQVTPITVSATSTNIKPPTSSTVKPISTETISQKNAVKKAKSYLGYSAFSRDGLVTQLEFEQFSHTDAVYGADNSGANWNEQAAKKAKSYMEYSAFSRGSLIEQLMHEKFTQQQAEYGVNAVGL